MAFQHLRHEETNDQSRQGILVARQRHRPRCRVGIAIGVAFTTLVGAFGQYFINPIVALVGGGNSNGFAWTIINSNPKTTIDFGAIINALIVFAVTMAVIYFAVVVPVKKIQDRRKSGVEEEPEEVPEDIALLREIRDSLNTRG